MAKMQITVNHLKNFEDNDGIMLRAGHPISYSGGYQVADYGKTCKRASTALKYVKEFKGNCGIWFKDGVYYVDHSIHVPTKKEAVKIGKAHRQQTILRWKDLEVLDCK